MKLSYVYLRQNLCFSAYKNAVLINLVNISDIQILTTSVPVGRKAVFINNVFFNVGSNFININGIQQYIFVCNKLQNILAILVAKI